jgi:hypothetical protein
MKALRVAQAVTLGGLLLGFAGVARTAGLLRGAGVAGLFGRARILGCARVARFLGRTRVFAGTWIRLTGGELDALTGNGGRRRQGNCARQSDGGAKGESGAGERQFLLLHNLFLQTHLVDPLGGARKPLGLVRAEKQGEEAMPGSVAKRCKVPIRKI